MRSRKNSSAVRTQTTEMADEKNVKDEVKGEQINIKVKDQVSSASLAVNSWFLNNLKVGNSYFFATRARCVLF
jgi:hypothetical protein